jgi:hypothetical protein
MSTHAVSIVEIPEILPHENADRLGIVTVGGWSCVVAKDQFKAGDRAVYVEPDYVVPLSRPEFSFLAKGKEGKSEHRMKAVRLRGRLSFGLLIPVPEDCAELPAGACVMERLGIRSLWTRAMLESDQAPRLADLCKACPDVVFYGEVFGPVQELRYGLKEPEFAIFAACDRGEWWWSEKLFSALAKFDVREAPALFRGAYDRAMIAALAERDTCIGSAPKGHMMEGVVIVAEPPRRDPNIGRVALKLISNRYWES